VVVFYNLPDNARTIIEQAYKHQTTAASKERGVHEDHLIDEASSLHFARSRDTGSVHWEGFHYAVALTPEHAANIESRTNIRLSTPAEETLAHRIDFFKQGGKASDMKAIRYISIQNTGWEQPKKTFKPRFDYSNPNAATKPTHADLVGAGASAHPHPAPAAAGDYSDEMQQRIAMLTLQLETQKRQLDRLLSKNPPPAEAEQETDKK
jgi:hypothetical protein